MEHFSSVRPTGKFPEKVENLKRSPPGPFFSVGISERNFLLHLYVSRSLYQFQVHGWALRRTGVYHQMEQLFTNRKFHFCSHRNFRVFFLNGKRPKCPIIQGFDRTKPTFTFNWKLSIGRPLFQALV